MVNSGRRPGDPVPWARRPSAIAAEYAKVVRARPTAIRGLGGVRPMTRTAERFR